MKIGIIADIHGNCIALDAVLDELKSEGIEQIVCLGDIVGLGPQPREVMDRLRALDLPTVMGNADEFMVNEELLAEGSPSNPDNHHRELLEMERWCRAQLLAKDVEYIRGFRPTIEIAFGNGESLLCYHGSPRSNWEEIRASTPDAELAGKLGERRTLLMAGGHTHEQFVRRLEETIVMNPGSVGLAFEIMRDGGDRNPPWAEYAVVAHEEGKLMVELRRVPVDQEGIREAYLESGIPQGKKRAGDWR